MDAEPVRNVELLRRVMNYAEENPEKVDQDSWSVRDECGTRACFAGLTVILNGGEIIYYKSNGIEEAESCIFEGKTELITAVAQRLLGINKAEADYLFMSNEDDLRDRVDSLIEEATRDGD